uniref:Uncharacterized protein n=1 Tax=Cyprinus carpio TaxID=7962 RepID=A0A8C1PFF9_CYPCA
KNTCIRSFIIVSSDLSLTASHVETEHRGSSATQRERRASGEPYWAYSGDSFTCFAAGKDHFRATGQNQLEMLHALSRIGNFLICKQLLDSSYFVFIESYENESINGLWRIYSQ